MLCPLLQPLFSCLDQLKHTTVCHSWKLIPCLQSLASNRISIKKVHPFCSPLASSLVHIDLYIPIKCASRVKLSSLLFIFIRKASIFEVKRHIHEKCIVFHVSDDATMLMMITDSNQEEKHYVRNTDQQSDTKSNVPVPLYYV